ncbi:MAG: FAD:protein FMN transferase [Pseudomonadota bacterium]
MISRRRFITIVAAATALPWHATAQTSRWRGRALGADATIDLMGAPTGALDAALAMIRTMEKTFSLQDPASELSQLNANGGGRLSPHMAALLHEVDALHHATGGLFDPTVQPVFRALAEGRTPPWESVAWEQVELSGDKLKLGDGQALTLNGIAQGYATDQVRAVLKEQGLEHALISLGEYAAIGGPFRLSIEDPHHGAMGYRTLENTAIATSSPSALQLGDKTHILNPKHNAATYWSTVSVLAERATLADGLSTAVALMPGKDTQLMARQAGVDLTLVDQDGDLTSIKGRVG